MMSRLPNVDIDSMGYEILKEFAKNLIELVKMDPELIGSLQKQLFFLEHKQGE